MVLTSFVHATSTRYERERVILHVISVVRNYFLLDVIFTERVFSGIKNLLQLSP